MRIQEKMCFICGNSEVIPVISVSAENDYKFFTCPNCGNYSVDIHSGCYIESEQNDFFSKAPALAFERNLTDRDNYTLTWNHDLMQACIGDIPYLSEYPLTFPERMDRVLLNIARILKFDPTLAIPDKSLRPAMFFVDMVDSETHDYLPAIKAMISVLKTEDLVGYHHDTLTHKNLHLTYKGAVRAIELNRKISDSKNAFLAMWFDNSMKECRPLFETAVRRTGYFLHIVDEVHHNDFIMDKVLNLIKESRFVIADLTCAPEVDGVTPSKGVRGGVYLEAGYAKGLGKQVIFTCRDDPASRARIHFDVKQVNTIFWNEESPGVLKAFGKYDFGEYLKERIIATVGKGPVPVPEL